MSATEEEHGHGTKEALSSVNKRSTNTYLLTYSTVQSPS